MNDQYRPDLKANVTTDNDGTVRQVLHTDERWEPSQENPVRTAMEYLRGQAGLFALEAVGTDHLHEPVTYTEPRAEGASYRLSDQKRQFDSVTVGFAQTYLNIPVWRSGVSVTVKGGPSRVVSSTNTALPNVHAELPSEEAVDRWRQVVTATERRTPATAEATRATPSDRLVRQALGLNRARNGEAMADVVSNAARLRVNRGRFFIYRYDPAQRQPAPPANDDANPNLERDHVEPTFPLPPVPDSIQPGSDYLVAEVLFTLPFGGIERLNWRALIEVETNAVLYLRALIAGINALVYTYDPLTSTGVLTNTSNQTGAILDTFRDDVTLDNLNGPVAGVQSLVGSRVRLIHESAPDIAPPVQPAGADFNYVARSNDFAAANAYYHADELFSTIEDLGFDLATYFDGTTFPVHVDHRASADTTDGIEINAFCGGNETGDGIGLVGFCLGDTDNVAEPLGRAVDKWVHWHEVGGHGILWDHVESPNFGFAHSAGDGLAALQNDPESLLRPFVERFRYAPFRPRLERWMNRDVADGWGWGGVNDSNGYESEQILATSHFRFYRSIGGDSDNLARRWFASRVASYLILRTVGDLTPATNPASALIWCKLLMASDLLDWTSEGLAGGAYNKVIRWAFEKQGLFQPDPAPVPVIAAGLPPEVDVYIDDGRAGEYPYQEIHWNNLSIWNRNAADGLTTHQPAVEGATNFAYVKIKNRGTTAANNVTVKGYHSLPGAGLTWPVDFTAMSPAAGLTAAAVPANSAGEVTVGPFEWVPNTNAFGHDCLLLIASVGGDRSNVDNLVAGETFAEWRLVPNDNNIGQRNIQLVPGSGEGLTLGLPGKRLWIGNPNIKRATMELRVALPEWLTAAGWAVTFRDLPDARFDLDSGGKREVVLDLRAGQDFDRTRVEQETDRDITVLVYAGDLLVGGMTYRLEPSLAQEPGETRLATLGSADMAETWQHALALLHSLNIPASQVTRVRAKKITLELDLTDDRDGW